MTVCKTAARSMGALILLSTSAFAAQFISIDIPGAFNIAALSINNAGQVVGATNLWGFLRQAMVRRSKSARKRTHKKGQTPSARFFAFKATTPPHREWTWATCDQAPPAVTPL